MTSVPWSFRPCRSGPRPSIGASAQAMSTSHTWCTKRASIASLNRLQSRASAASLSGAAAANIDCRRRWIGSMRNSALDALPASHVCRTMTFGAVSAIQVCQVVTLTASRLQLPCIAGRARFDATESLRQTRERWIGTIRISISRNTQTRVSSVTRPKRVSSWGAGFGTRSYRPRPRYSEMRWSIVARTEGMGRCPPVKNRRV